MSALDRNDAPGVHAPSWYAETAAPFPERPAPTGALKADVAVIGGGFSGLSTALHCAEAGASVVLLEAHRIGWGASGRNGGQVGVGQRVDQMALEKMVGLPRAREAWEIGRGATQLVRDLVARHGIDCDLQDGLLYVNHRARYDAEAEELAEHMQRVYGHASMRYVPPEEMPSMLGARGMSGGTYDSFGAHLHPLDYARGLARAAQAAGAQLHETARVSDIAPGRVTLTNGAQVEADRIVVAANGYLDRLLPGPAARILPINNYVVATEPLGEARAKALIPCGAAVADSRFVVNYFRLSADHRLLFGGGESYGEAFPRDIVGLVRRRMEALYPALKGVRVTHAWGGTLGITLTRLPVFAEPMPGVFSVGGYSGSGVALATMAGKLLAEAFAGERARFDAMAALPAPKLPGGALLRRPAMIAAMLLAQARDMI